MRVSPDDLLRDPDLRAKHELALLNALHTRRFELATLLRKYSGHGEYEDRIYRFYHQSCKLFWLQDSTAQIVTELQALAPDLPLNEWFQQIVLDGTGKKFELMCNHDWLKHTRAIPEAFFHARYMLEMAVRYSELPEPPAMLPSGWAALLSLFNLR